MTLIGYGCEIIFDCALGSVYVFVGTIMFYFVAMCQHHHAFYQIFEHMLNAMSHSDENPNVSLYRIIRFHITVKKYTQNLHEKTDNLIFVQKFQTFHGVV